ncbi:hypothetical protein JTE90_021251 [Oedothorax gibbosus]|uniref:GPI alpha-1,4-mannosyltransferase I, catalytic subunit n=1 Tax=Oedothorax gibbosus TaxID=931172 RepID=A0AAV6UV98_9ARAC|nr:hypothetical protein JTE90_021251 [Oedothorax gibbosus]
MELRWHCVAAFSLRLALASWGCVQDAAFAVRYTDVDYRVFSDAALHLWRGESPFLRPTYRYTPLVAVLLLPNAFLLPAFGKLLFSLADVLAGVLIHDIVRRQRTHDPLTCALFWLYCPLPAVLSTRGSCESLVTLLVLTCVWLVQGQRPVLAGLVFGLAVHFKIYPCIYAASLYFALTPGYERRSTGLTLLLRPSRRKVAFAAAAALGFLVPTLGSAWACGGAYVREALLHHVTRKDIRHNFSPFFYPLYLLEARPAPFVAYAGFALQAALVFACSLRVRPLPAALFLQTWLFVSLNKVCTSQYFAWPLCLLPLAWPRGAGRREGAWALAAWAGAQGAWLAAAHALEFGGRHVFAPVSAAALLLFAVHAALAALYARRTLLEEKAD